MGAVTSLFAALFGGADQPDPVTGMTAREKDAVVTSWTVVADKKEIRAHGMELFIILFTEHPKTLKFFPSFDRMDVDILRQDPTLFGHALTVMYSLGNLVSNLDNTEQLVLLIEKIARSHLARGVTTGYFKVLASVMPQFLKTRAGPVATEFVLQSWAKFLLVLVSLVQEMEEKQTTAAAT